VATVCQAVRQVHCALHVSSITASIPVISISVLPVRLPRCPSVEAVRVVSAKPAVLSKHLHARTVLRLLIRRRYNTDILYSKGQ
jgi:hypothetical protein